MNAFQKLLVRNDRVKNKSLPNPAGRRWSTAERKFEFLVAAREEEILAKQSRKPSVN